MDLRIKQFQTRLNEIQLDGYLITKDINIQYLTGFPASESWLFVVGKKSFFITDARYSEESEKFLKGVKVVLFQKSPLEEVMRLVKKFSVKRIGFDDRHISVFLHKRLRKSCPKGVRFLSQNNIVEKMRSLKHKQELALMRQAIALNLKAYSYLKRVMQPGLTEQEVLFRLEKYVRGRKAGFSFDPIIASGPNSCLPHAKVTSRKIKKNDLVLVDMGIDIKGYKSDLTRMFFFGKIPPLVKDAYDQVDLARKKAIAQIKPGVPIALIDGEARKSLKEKSLDEYFSHSLGHGVGLDVHEEPRISQKNSDVLEEGMVFTVEPAVYFPKRFGIRIEDMVLVTREGCSVLSR